MRARLRTALACAVSLVVGPVGSARCDTGSRPVSVAIPGEALASSFRQALAKRFAAASLPVAFSPWDGRLASVQQREAAGGPEPDVLLIDTADALAACRQGLLAPAEASPNAATQSEHGATCFVPAFETALVLAWDKTRDPTPPNWSDFWDVARTPGKRGLPRRPRGTLEIALLADGVSPADIYRTLDSAAGIDRAFRKLEQLRPYVVWWTDGEQARKALISGGVLMTAAPAAYGSAGAAHPVAVGQQWTGALIDTLAWAVPTRAPDPAAGWRFIQLQAQPSWQAAITELVPLVGLAPGVQGAISDDLLARTVAAPHRAEQGLTIDDRFWSEHPDLSGRFEAWLTPPR